MRTWKITSKVEVFLIWRVEKTRKGQKVMGQECKESTVWNLLAKTQAQSSSNTILVIPQQNNQN